ncbi:class I SAM-dependent methyltransferase [Azohydromonas australica]|uniref:class I SAM-dependent methyltransferase n=1 Tax=Azohydromonas australica TaxID=364039 RepID=UPI00146B054A
MVEFGCGDGTLPLALPPQAYSKYIGYDISEVATRTATDRAQAAGLSNCSFKQCDMAQWKGDKGVALFVIEECLYYLNSSEAESFLLRCCDSLAPGGSVLVVVHSASKHASTVSLCKSVCLVQEELTIGDRIFLVLAPMRVGVYE